jgi:hypothetical protein
MKKFLSIFLMALVVTALAISCTEENVQPSAEKINNTSNATIRD